MSGSTGAAMPRLALPLPPGTLLADIGGTNTRFASSNEDGTLLPAIVLPSAGFHGFEEALSAYLAAAGLPAPSRAAIAVACPVAGDDIRFTNIDWQFSIAALRDRLDLTSLLVVNDAAAIAHALPKLTGDDLDIWQAGMPATAADTGRALAMVAPGTGLGIAGLVPTTETEGARWHAVSGEGGHASLPAFDDEEADIIARLRARFGHVSAERAVSGTGLANLYAAVAECDRHRIEIPKPEALPGLLETGDECARRTFSLFSGFLGTIAADIVLTFGATGGLYLGGGVLSAIGDAFDRPRFLARFADKGRFSDLLGATPVAHIRHPYPAFVGLAAFVAQATGTDATT